MNNTNDGIRYQPKWIISKYDNAEKYANDLAYEYNEIDGNLLLNEGIAELLALLIGSGGTAFNNANTRLGVGDSTTAAAATQTGLVAATNKLYKAMETGYPQVSAQTVTFRAVFNAGEATFDWREFTAANGIDDTAVNLNRKVDATQGTKGASQVWTLDLEITFS